jgi:thioredoxin-disulfide reductase/thioredoxin
VTEVRNVIIIGSGPTGYTAALYAARGELKPLVFEGSVTAGGALMQTTDVENFPGFPDAIMGPELMDAMRKQAERFGAELVPDDVVAVDLTANPKVVKTDSETYLAKAVIIATGSRYKELGVPGEKVLGGHGVSWCATCDGFFFRGHDIAVIGGGDSALEEAMFLTRFGKSVTVVHRRDTLRASKIMQDRAFANPKITFRWDSEVAEVLGSDKVTGLLIRSTKDGTEHVLPVTGVVDAHRHRGCLRRRRRRRPHLPAGRHRGRDGLRGGARRRTLADQPGALTPSSGMEFIHRKSRDVIAVGATKVVTEETFDAEVLKSEKPVIVDYWAEWCGPCRMVAPVLEEIATEYADKIDVVKLNIDENPSVSQRYGIMAIPTMSVFSGGQVVKQIVGAKPKSALLRELAEYI